MATIFVFLLEIYEIFIPENFYKHRKLELSTLIYRKCGLVICLKSSYGSDSDDWLKVSQKGVSKSNFFRSYVLIKANNFRISWPWEYSATFGRIYGSKSICFRINRHLENIFKSPKLN